MYSELECGICYRTYNAGRRCPRELLCKHSFCESCLLALSRPLGPEEAHPGADKSIVCPLCRHTTSISGEGTVRAGLRVDECVLERLLAEGVLDQEEDPEEEEEEDGHVQGGFGDCEEATLPDSQAEESDSFADSRSGRIRRGWRKVWQKISGKSSRQRSGENCMTGDDIRNLAMMSCYMF
ncbi:RING finger protein 227 [Morone saxatilis]|uniref:RING finger protein 227 n=1 Tax=Morone saxatilis TaxID=34816 RepID=UPI0015E1C158|nr:RING finger protein 227 [Morone saxatilis]